MKTYYCTCGQLIFFENLTCVNCQRGLGFLSDKLELSSLEEAQQGLFRPSTQAEGNLYRRCQNYTRKVSCNWMVAEQNEEGFCASCRLDEIIPNLSEDKNRLLWGLIENAKRRLVYTLMSLKLPVRNRKDDPSMGLAFRFLSDEPSKPVLTGHDGGIITLNLLEADDVERERRRVSLNEPYRTLLGHFRHEIGHYYWDLLVRDSKYLLPFRQLFGDEQADYGEALKRYYSSGAPSNWQNTFISAYATAHPWEDWAETWAHYLHIQDTLEVALQFGLADKRLALHQNPDPSENFSPTSQKSFPEKIEAWAQLSIALNSINRSMGLKDIYPFVLSNPVVTKLRFIFDVISGNDVNLG